MTRYSRNRARRAVKAVYARPAASAFPRQRAAVIVTYSARIDGCKTHTHTVAAAACIIIIRRCSPRTRRAYGRGVPYIIILLYAYAGVREMFIAYAPARTHTRIARLRIIMLRAYAATAGEVVAILLRLKNAKPRNYIVCAPQTRPTSVRATVRHRVRRYNNILWAPVGRGSCHGAALIWRTHLIRQESPRRRAGRRADGVIYDCKSRIGARGRRHRYRYYYYLRGGLLYGSVFYLLALVV